jgi:hypothetical protein
MRIDGTEAMRAAGAADQAFGASLTRALAKPDPGEPAAPREGFGKAKPPRDAQPMDPSRPELWLGNEPPAVEGFGPAPTPPPPPSGEGSYVHPVLPDENRGGYFPA